MKKTVNTKKDLEKSTKDELKKNTSKEKKASKKKLGLIFYLIMFVIVFAVCLYFASKTIIRKNPVPINYSQKGNIEYKVFLNKNDFYTEKYLEMNKSYVASLIKYIDVDFNYLFNISEKANLDFDYKIIGELVIENSKGSGRYLEKEYTLLDSTKKKLIDEKAINIKENIKIDYGYYNQLVNSFKSTYGVDINSYLNVFLEVNPKTTNNSNYKINEKNRISLRIPLSEKAIEINLNASNKNVVNQIIPDGDVEFNSLYLILEVVFLIPTCIFLVKIIKIILIKLDIYTPYDRYVNKQLKEYDRLIVETNSDLKTKGYNIINIRSFTELLDARDNLNLPILYSNTVPHEEGMFYIINNNDIYMLEINKEFLNKR